MAAQFKKLTPLFNRILVQKFEVQTKTSSGIILTEQSNSNQIAKVVEVRECESKV